MVWPKVEQAKPVKRVNALEKLLANAKWKTRNVHRTANYAVCDSENCKNLDIQHGHGKCRGKCQTRPGCYCKRNNNYCEFNDDTNSPINFCKKCKCDRSKCKNTAEQQRVTENCTLCTGLTCESRCTCKKIFSLCSDQCACNPQSCKNREVQKVPPSILKNFMSVNFNATQLIYETLQQGTVTYRGWCKNETVAEHAELIFNKNFLQIPLDLAPSIKFDEIRVFLTRSPCDEIGHDCCQRIIEVFNHLKSLILNPKMSVFFAVPYGRGDSCQEPIARMMENGIRVDQIYSKREYRNRFAPEEINRRIEIGKTHVKAAEFMLKFPLFREKLLFGMVKKTKLLVQAYNYSNSSANSEYYLCDLYLAMEISKFVKK